MGFFDGVHLGHRFLIEQVKKEAARLNLPSAVITFPVHPRKVLQQEYQPALLSGYDEKLHQLETTGIDYCFSLPFTRELSQYTAEEFIVKVLSNQMGVHTLFVGHDHRFGHNREEGFIEYSHYGETVGMNVVQAKEFRYHDHPVSSSRVRTLLKEGNIIEANALLSYNYTISGKIVEGYQVGRTIGFPTANIKSWEKYKVIPKLGVYAVKVHLENNDVYNGMLYIGKRPTLRDNMEVSVEVNIFDFNGDLYNQHLSVEFIDFVRSDEKFPTIEELTDQIQRDKINVISRLNKAVKAQSGNNCSTQLEA